MPRPNSPLSTYERAQLVLKAWDMLEGWGLEQPDGRIKKWSYEQRTKEAKALVDAAIAP